MLKMIYTKHIDDNLPIRSFTTCLLQCFLINIKLLTYLIFTILR